MFLTKELNDYFDSILKAEIEISIEEKIKQSSTKKEKINQSSTNEEDRDFDSKFTEDELNHLYQF
jgi:hypothetical protein